MTPAHLFSIISFVEWDGGPVIDLTRLPVLLIDCQATGANPRRGHLLEVAWCLSAGATGGQLRREQVEARLVSLPPGSDIPRRVSTLTGLRKEDLHGALPLSQVAAAVGAALQEAARAADRPRAVAVAHCARFEEGFLGELHDAVGATLSERMELVCTLEIARRLLPDLPRRGLHALAGYLGLVLPRERRAADHVVATALIWHEFTRRLGAEHGVTTLAELGAWLEAVAPRKAGAPRVFPMSRRQRLAAPDAPGVYRMLAKGGEVLYVGKAGSLRARLNSHFYAQQRGGDERLLELLTQVRSIDYTVVATALEAALAEADEIKQREPPYNVALLTREPRGARRKPARAASGRGRGAARGGESAKRSGADGGTSRPPSDRPGGAAAKRRHGATAPPTEDSSSARFSVRAASVVFASRDFAELAREPDDRCSLGPFPAPGPLRGLGWLLAELDPVVVPIRPPDPALAAQLRADLGLPREAGPGTVMFGLGLELFASRHGIPPGGLRRALPTLGARLWRQVREAARSPESEDADRSKKERSFQWDPERVAGWIEWLVLRVTHLMRRAGWLCRLTQASLAWNPAGTDPGRRRCLLIDRGKVVDAADGPAPPPPGIERSLLERQQTFDLAGYDRLRILTTEIRRLVDAGADVELRLGRGRPLGPHALRQRLAWL